MSLSHVMGYHLLGNIRDCSNLCITRCPLSAHLSLPTGGPNTPIVSTSATGDLEVQQDVPSHSGGCPHSLLFMRGVGTKTGHYTKTRGSHLRFHSIALCICTGLKIPIIKRIFFKDSSEPWGKKNSKETNIWLKIGVFMRGILSSFEENNSLCGEEKKNKMAASHLL